MLLKLGILGGRAHHHTSFLGLLKFCDLLHIWNTSWMLKSRKCGKNNSGWITVVFQVLVSDLGKCGFLGSGRVKNSVSTKLNGQWFLRFFEHSVFLEKKNSCSTQSSKLVSHVTTSILFVEHNLMKSSPFFCVGDAGQFSFKLVVSGTVLVGAIFVRVPQHFLVFFFANVCNLLVLWLQFTSGCSCCWKMCVLSSVHQIFKFAWVWQICCMREEIMLAQEFLSSQTESV